MYQENQSAQSCEGNGKHLVKILRGRCLLIPKKTVRRDCALPDDVSVRRHQPHDYDGNEIIWEGMIRELYSNP